MNKYVGETERQIRLVFERAREKSDEGWPVIVFFDEMDSMFRTRGTGVSSDMESTVVPQLLAEIDGVEGLENVIVIGATNREDLIDPAILRPGRLDVKIRIDRPDAHAARQVFLRYLNDEIPLGEGETVDQMVSAAVEEMYRVDDDNRFLEVTYANGDKEVLYFKDFASGAMVENIGRRFFQYLWYSPPAAQMTRDTSFFVAAQSLPVKIFHVLSVELWFPTGYVANATVLSMTTISPSSNFRSMALIALSPTSNSPIWWSLPPAP